MCGPPNQHCCQLDHTIPASDLFVRLINPLKSSLAGVVADYAGTGRLEVFYNNEWGTVCDDDFGDKEALAFCKKLGFRYGAKIATPASQQGSGRIWLDAVDCDVSPGGTGDLSKCITRNGWGKNDCAHDEDVVLACSNDARVPVGAGIRGTAIRLAGPDAASGYGRLEVNYNEVWGTVCDDEFGLEEAGAFCRSLGFSGGGVIASPTPASLQGSGQIFMDSVDCSSNSEPASSCTHNGWGRHDCDHAEDVVLRCFRASPPPPPPAQPSFKTIAYTDCLSGPSCSQVVFDVANTPSYTYDAARQYCASVGGTLASIRSAAEQEFLKSQLLDASSPTGFWIGLYNPGIPSTSRSAFQW